MSNSSVKTVNKVLFYRLQNNLTQTDLSEKSGLSVRTIQRVESGITPKGHTLKSIAAALDIEVEELKEKDPIIEDRSENIEITSLKILNISALLFLVFPYGNLIFPFIIWNKKSKDFKSNKIALQILNLQIFYSLLLTLFMLFSPFFQKFFDLKFSLLLTVFIIFSIANIFFILINSFSLNRTSNLKITSPFSVF